MPKPTQQVRGILPLQTTVKSLPIGKPRRGPEEIARRTLSPHPHPQPLSNHQVQTLEKSSPALRRASEKVHLSAFQKFVVGASWFLLCAAALIAATYLTGGLNLAAGGIAIGGSVVIATPAANLLASGFKELNKWAEAREQAAETASPEQTQEQLKKESQELRRQRSHEGRKHKHKSHSHKSRSKRAA